MDDGMPRRFPFFRRDVVFAGPTPQAQLFDKIDLRQYGIWIALSWCSSAFLLAVTNDLCQEIAPIPLLWIAPLAIYLLSFVLCFDYGVERSPDAARAQLATRPGGAWRGARPT